MIDRGIEPRPQRTADATRTTTASPEFHRRITKPEVKGTCSVCWYRRAPASRRMQNVVTALRANPILQAVSESQGSTFCLFSTCSANRRFVYRLQPGAYPKILVSRRSDAACGPKNSFSWNGEGIAKRTIRAPGGAGRRRLCCQANSILRSREQADGHIESRQSPPRGCFVSKIDDPASCVFSRFMCSAARFVALIWWRSVGANLPGRLNDSSCRPSRRSGWKWESAAWFMPARC